jgi:solute carrier family 13 (sodium-dependent dicarboxylate transporter), member 2/3/5
MRRFRIDSRLCWVLIAAIFLLLLLPAPEGLTPAGWNAIVVFLVIVVMWITEVVPLPVAAVFAVVLQPVLGVASTTEALSAFGSSAVFLILAGFLLGAGLVRSHLDKRIAYLAIRKSRNSSVALFAIIVVTAVLSMIMSNTATVLLMVPIVLTLCAKAGLNKKAFLLSTAYAANVGGVGMLVGTPPNVIAAEALGWGFLEWMYVGLPFALMMLPLLYVSMVIVYRPHKRIDESILRRLENLGPMTALEKRTAGIIILTLALWITSPLHGIPAAAVGLFGGFLMLATVYNWSFLERHTNWGVIILIGGAISVANALTSTGAAQWIAQGFLSMTGLTNPILITFAFALLAMAVTQSIQNTATTGMLAPILVGIMSGLGVTSPGLLVIPVIATSMTFLLPPGTAPNAIVHGTGHISTKEMFRAGLIPTGFAILLLLVYSIVL